MSEQADKEINVLTAAALYECMKVKKRDPARRLSNVFCNKEVILLVHVLLVRVITNYWSI